MKLKIKNWTGAMTTAKKINLLLSYNLKTFIQQWDELAVGGGNKNFVGEYTGGNEQIFGQWEDSF